MVKAGAKVFGYCRVSTEEQAVDGRSLEVQQDRLRAFAAENGLELVRVFEDAGYGGTSPWSRPQFREMLKACRRGEAEAVLVLRVDRLSRKTQDVLRVAERVAVRSVLEPFDTSTPDGEFMLTLVAAMGRRERRVTVDRIKETIAHKRARGERLGGPAPFGWRLRNDVPGHTRHIKPVEAEQEAIETMKEMRNAGKTLREIGAAVGLSHEAVRKVLAREAR